MRRLVPEVEDLELDAAYEGLTLTDGADGPSGRRAWVALGVVSSLDGSATVEGRSARLGGEPDRIAFSRLRASCDAVLVGAGTVRAEGYRPVSGNPARRSDRTARGLSAVPRLVVISSSLDLRADHPIFSDPAQRPMVVTHTTHEPEALAAVAEVAEVLQFGDDEVDLAGTVQELAARGLTRVLCEGGPRLAGSLHDQDLIDELFVTVAATTVGGSGPRIVMGAAERPRPMQLVSLYEHGGELLLRYHRQRSPEGR